MATNMKEYVGARYVPILGRKDEDSIIWDDTKPYESLTIVLYQGNSYTSRKAVPTGVSIFNEEYWAPTGNYNAQIEQYRRDIVRYRELVDEVDEKIDKEIQDREDADTALGAIIPASAFSSTDTVKKYIDEKISDETTARQNATSYLQGEIDDINGFLPNNLSNISSLNDYIVEQGTATTIGANASASTSWIYRKWASGIAECWGKRPEEANINQEWGELFENYQTMYEVFPSNLFIDVPIYVDTQWSGTWAMVETAGGLSSTRSQDFKLIRATESEVTGYVMTYAIGRWK